MKSIKSHTKLPDVKASIFLWEILSYGITRHSKEERKQVLGLSGSSIEHQKLNSAGCNDASGQLFHQLIVLLAIWGWEVITFRALLSESRWLMTKLILIHMSMKGGFLKLWTDFVKCSPKFKVPKFEFIYLYTTHLSAHISIWGSLQQLKQNTKYETWQYKQHSVQLTVKGLAKEMLFAISKMSGDWKDVCISLRKHSISLRVTQEKAFVPWDK